MVRTPFANVWRFALVHADALADDDETAVIVLVSKPAGPHPRARVLDWIARAHKPVVTCFRVPVAICPVCRARVQGRQPEQTSDALGAAAVPLGPRLLGLAADLKHRLGVSYRKTAGLILTLTGPAVTAAALTRSGHRLRRHAKESHRTPSRHTVCPLCHRITCLPFHRSYRWRTASKTRSRMQARPPAMP